jgi:uncharacterized protein YjbI with pentapeptide repeats
MLRGANMLGRGELIGLDLSYANLVHSRWNYTGQLGDDDTSFQWSDASYAQFQGAELAGNFSHNIFVGAIFNYAGLHNAHFDGSNFESANFSRAYSLRGTRFTNSNFTNAIFASASFGKNSSAGEYEFTDFSGSIFNGTRFQHSDFKHAKFLGSDFTGSLNWSTANWTGAKYNDNTIFAEGMDPNALGMVHVPAPSVLALLGITGLYGSRRRRE